MGEVDPGVNDGDLDASAIDSPVPCLLNTQQIITEPAFVVGLAGLDGGFHLASVVWGRILQGFQKFLSGDSFGACFIEMKIWPLRWGSSAYAFNGCDFGQRSQGPHVANGSDTPQHSDSDNLDFPQLIDGKPAFGFLLDKYSHRDFLVLTLFAR